MLLLRMTHMLISTSSCDHFHPSFPVKQVILFHFKPSMSCYAISANNIIPKKHTFQLWTLKRFQTIRMNKIHSKRCIQIRFCHNIQKPKTLCSTNRCHPHLPRRRTVITISHDHHQLGVWPPLAAWRWLNYPFGIRVVWPPKGVI